MVDSTTTDTRDADRGFMRQLIRNMSGLSITYSDSPLTVPDDDPVAGGDSGEGPRPGQRLTQISAADAQSPGWTALRALLRTSAWHLLVCAGNGHSSSPDQVTADATSRLSWLDTVTISRSRVDGDDHEVWDPDGRVRDTLAATEGHWILVRPDGYVSARGAGNTSLRDALDRLTTLRGREAARA
jgi:NADPH-dependent dioxygenase